MSKDHNLEEFLTSIQQTTQFHADVLAIVQTGQGPNKCTRDVIDAFNALVEETSTFLLPKYKNTAYITKLRVNEPSTYNFLLIRTGQLKQICYSLAYCYTCAPYDTLDTLWNQLEYAAVDRWNFAVINELLHSLSNTLDAITEQPKEEKRRELYALLASLAHKAGTSQEASE